MRNAILIPTILLLFAAAARGEGLQPPSPPAEEPPGAVVSALDTTGDGREDFRLRDTDGDGRGDEIDLDMDGDGLFDERIVRGALPPEESPEIVCCFDSVYYGIFKDLWEKGHYRLFYSPSVAISTFPSDTNPAFTEILGTPKCRGYEDRYYDRDRNRLVGGLMVHLQKWHPERRRTFHSRFEYEEHPIYGGMVYLTCRFVSSQDIKKFTKNLFKAANETPAEQPPILYLGSTDAVGHKKGEAMMRDRLLKLEKVIARLFRETKGRVRLHLFSDHSNDMVHASPIPLEEHLEMRGFRVGGRLKGSKTAVIPRYGLVNSVYIYCGEEDEEAIAEALTSLKGVDFSVYMKGGVVYVRGHRGLARISKRPDTDAYRLENLEGDPLLYGEVPDYLKEKGLLDREGYASDAAWFDATKALRYPDAVRRFWIAMTDLVINRANVIVSLDEGWYFGNRFFGMVVDLKSTHGSALDTSTNGFVASSDKPLPSHVRMIDLWKAMTGKPRPGDQ